MANKDSAENNQVTIQLTNDLSVKLNTNSPNIDKLISEIVANRNTIKVDSIRVECDDKKFDRKSFQEIVQKTVIGLINDITIEEAAVNNARKWINERIPGASSQEVDDDAEISTPGSPEDK